MFLRWIASCFLFVAAAAGSSLPAELTVTSGVLSITSDDSGGRNNNQDAVTVAASCWQQMVGGRRLHPQFIIRSVSASSLEDCQKECEQVLFHCETIAYGAKTLVTNTSCDLSDWPTSNLSFAPHSSDTIISAVYAVYNRFGSGCPSSHPPSVTGNRTPAPATPQRPSPLADTNITEDGNV